MSYFFNMMTLKFCFYLHFNFCRLNNTKTNT
nr:MAG TPA: hypothetical protein [Caudoviricetes sp.]